MFDRILTYFISGTLDVTDLTPFMMNMLRDDFYYYFIPLPKEIQLEWDVNRKSDTCSLSNDNSTVTCNI